MKMMDTLLHSYKKWIPSIRNNKNFWRTISQTSSNEKIQENQQNLGTARKVIDRINLFKNVDLGDEKISKRQIEKATWELEDLIEKFLQFLINSEPDENRWPDECLELVKIFYPLYLLREQSGIVMLTYAKFETTVPYFNFNGERWVKKQFQLDKYVTQYTSDSRKFILAFDEQEEGYHIMLKKMIDIIAPETLAINNALSSINREFSVLFSANSEENRKLLKFAMENPGGFEEFEEYLGKNKVIEQHLEGFARIYQRLTLEEGNSRNFLEEMVNIIKGLEHALQDIARIFEVFHEEKPVTFDFEMLHRVFSKFENNRSLLIPREVYEQAKHNLWNIFTFNDLYIYNIEPLKTLFLTRRSSGHVNITEQETPHSPSLAELIYAMFAVRLQLHAIKSFLANVLNADDSQSRSLDIWSNQAAKIQNARKEEITPPKKSDYLDHAYVYEEYKSIINIKEISRYQNPANDLINRGLREVSIGNTAILASPEKKIASMTETGGNSIFLISATGGISGDLSTSYDMHHLEDALRDKESGLSSFKRMTPEEVRLCGEIRKYRQSFRHVSVGFFYRDLPSFPNVQTQGVIERFEKTVLQNFIESRTHEGRRFGIYKIQELKNFIRFLFYLFEDDSIQEIFGFTQTLAWIKQLIRECELAKNEYEFKQSQEHPNIYYVLVAHKRYQSPLRIKLILYDAAFNKRYNDQSTQKTYQDELFEKENEKIFFISAYRSASKGFNPIVKTQNDGEKDFDCLVLLMDAYYTIMNPPPWKESQKSGGRRRRDWQIGNDPPFCLNEKPRGIKSDC